MAQVYGQSDYGPAVWGESTNSKGVLGVSTNSQGVLGQSTNWRGVVGQSTNWDGVVGVTASKDPTDSGVWGQNRGAGPGVIGTGDGTGVLGQSTGGTGVRGISTATPFIAEPGVAGVSDSGSGVDGRSENWFGVLGLSTNGVGVIGMCRSADGTAVIGKSTSPGQKCKQAGLFHGPVDVHGDLTVYNGNKPFKIDHPLAPQNKYLLHNAVESSERKNVYDGVEQLDEDGAAWVDLPEWFEALNGDFRYQLTAVGGPAPNLHVGEEIYENRFKIVGGEVGMKVCWQVTGSRKDPWAAANPFEVEQEKPEKDRGRYLQPDLYDAPDELRVMIGPEEEKLRQMMRHEPPQPPQYPQPPGFEPPQAPEMPPDFDLEVNLLRQINELRQQIEELKRARVEDEHRRQIDDLRRQIEDLRRRL